MNIVHQRTPWDCGIAGIAMLFDLTYEQAEAKFPYRCGDIIPGTETPFGVMPWDALWIGIDLGIPCAMLAPREVFVDAGWPMAPHMVMPGRAGLWDWLQGRRALLSVESQNYVLPDGSNGQHVIAWDGRHIVDPMAKRHPARHFKPDSRPDFLDAVVRLDITGG